MECCWKGRKNCNILSFIHLLLVVAGVYFTHTEQNKKKAITIITSEQHCMVERKCALKIQALIQPHFCLFDYFRAA